MNLQTYLISVQFCALIKPLYISGTGWIRFIVVDYRSHDLGPYSVYEYYESSLCLMSYNIGEG